VAQTGRALFPEDPTLNIVREIWGDGTAHPRAPWLDRVGEEP